MSARDENVYHEAEYIDIVISDPTKVNEGEGEYTRYKISTEVCQIKSLIN